MAQVISINLPKCTYLDYTSLLLLSPSFLALDKLLSIIRPNTILLSIIFLFISLKTKRPRNPLFTYRCYLF